MAIGGILVFGERFRAAQWLGLALLVAGLGLFFRDQLVHVDTTPGHGGTQAYLAGSLLVVLGAVVWAVYALAQKQLLVKLGSMQILGVIYVVATLLLWPFAHPSQLARLDATQWALLAFCALNTVVAYGAFAEALAHWEASRVSAVIAVTPLLCLGVVALVHALWPSTLAPEPMSMVGWIGAALVVAGSTTVSLLGRRRPA
jgi:drug/metabolite transporter (DMT)-like permease